MGDVMELLGKFPMLRSVVLVGARERRDEEVVMTRMKTCAGSFPELKHLHLCNLMDLHEWEVEKGAMSKLEALYINDCRNLEKIPDGVEFISSLKIMKYSGTQMRYAQEVEQHFVGMEHVDRLVSMLIDDDSPSRILICGMGGIGKTSLSRKIYNHKDVQTHFDGHAWVCAPYPFCSETVLREIFKQIEDNETDMELPQLVLGLHHALMERKCVIVIDDIWQRADWRILKPAFPTKNCKVVLVSRNLSVASEASYSYMVSTLRLDQGLELLSKIALPMNVRERRWKSLEDIGRKMAEKCGGLPLTISLIGGILLGKLEVLGEWEEVISYMESYLKKDEEELGRLASLEGVLELCFDDLPNYLKPCFLYLACFPEDYVMDTERLYLLWLAEGLISYEEKGNNETLIDVAERYMTELANRRIVQVEKRKFNPSHTKFESFRLHDLVRDLCISKAKEQDFIKRVDISKDNQNIPSEVGHCIPRLAINLLDEENDPQLRGMHPKELKDLRSLLIFGNNRSTMRARDLESDVNLKNSKQLQILVLEGAQFEDGKLPTTVGTSISLKYLSLYHCNAKELPKRVCDLPHIQILDLRVQIGIAFKLPNLIWKMKRLKHLFLPLNLQVIGGDKLRLNGLNELETLKEINSRTSCIEDIITLTSLRSLHVVIEEDTESLSKIVDYLSVDGCPLRHTQLSIVSCQITNNAIEKMLKAPSLVHLGVKRCAMEHISSSYEQTQCMCPNLVTLEIACCKIEDDLMEAMGKFPNLQQLRLIEVVNKEMRSGTVNSFPELNSLCLQNSMNLHKWEMEKGSMSKLVDVNIRNCRNLEKLPDALRFNGHLKSLKCYGMSDEFKSRYMEGGENYADFSPSIPHFRIT